VTSRCPECGFDYETLPASETPAAFRAFADRYRVPLTRFLRGEDGDALLRAHPVADTWSALEYACHVRDVLEVQRERIARARVEDEFVPEPMHRDERVTELHYNEQSPSEVADAIALHSGGLADDLDGFSEADWARTMLYGYPELAWQPLSWVAVHTVHEGEHHLLDIGRVLRAARGR
jgi:hypothetical protein